jgi:enoyl-CoA hydratase
MIRAMSGANKSGPEVLVEDRGPVRWVWLNRPEKRNPQGVAMLTALERAVVEIEHDPAVRVMVLAGKGPAFSAGHNLKEAVTNPEYARRAETVEGRMWQELDVFVRPVEAIRRLRIPTICRVHGYCIAAAMMLVSVCDLVIAADDAQFVSNVTRDLGAAEVELPAIAWELGSRRAKQMIWTGEGLDANGALSAGLANWVVPLADLDRKVDEVAGELLRVPREAIALTKMSMQFAEDRAGRADTYAYHFLAHQISHATSETVAIREARVAAVAAKLSN